MPTHTPLPLCLSFSLHPSPALTASVWGNREAGIWKRVVAMVTHLKLKSRAGREMSINAITPPMPMPMRLRLRSLLEMPRRYFSVVASSAPLWLIPSDECRASHLLRYVKNARRGRPRAAGAKSFDLSTFRWPCRASDAILSGARNKLTNEVAS